MKCPSVVRGLHDLIDRLRDDIGRVEDRLRVLDSIPNNALFHFTFYRYNEKRDYGNRVVSSERVVDHEEILLSRRVELEYVKTGAPLKPDTDILIWFELIASSKLSSKYRTCMDDDEPVDRLFHTLHVDFLQSTRYVRVRPIRKADLCLYIDMVYKGPGFEDILKGKRRLHKGGR